MGRFEELGEALDLLFGKILNRNFNKADELIQKTEQELSAHKSSTQAHDAGSIAYSGAVIGAATAKQAIDNLKGEVNTIVASAGDGTKDTELILARGNEDTLGDRLDATDAQLAHTADQIESLTTDVSTKAPITYVDSKVASISKGTPEAFANLVAIQSIYPNGDEYVKLNLEDGYIYKWNGSAWEQGWPYQAAVYDQFLATNMIINGGFDEGIDGWNQYDVNVVGESGRLTFIATANNGRIQQNISTVENHVYYVQSVMKSHSSQVGLNVSKASAPFTAILPRINHTGSGDFEKIKSLFVASETTNKGYVFRISDQSVTNFDQITVDNILIVDLTMTFGAGKEPTAEEMDDILSSYHAGWFDGTVTLLDQLDLYEEIKSTKNYFDRFMITENEPWEGS